MRRRWDWKVWQEEESKKTTLDWRRYFSFFVVVLCSLVFRSRGKREKGTKKNKKGKKKFSRSKKVGFLSNIETSRQGRGLQNILLDRVENFSLNYNWAIQIPIGVINLNTRTHTLYINMPAKAPKKAAPKRKPAAKKAGAKKVAKKATTKKPKAAAKKKVAKKKAPAKKKAAKKKAPKKKAAKKKAAPKK